ncbi:CHAT domain-containing protein [Streptomyces sp. I5]|uniref:CHAT domain-containing protein n=1 Tax=Streptomyces sp. I5 TaxID=2759947 RepID=UPI0018EE558A|nr:CHAT domain-containing protein [Streptomyces sp. I5]MBJ6635874.1 CHAT domain-containing protein [Streptomyces sp. I5]
MGLKDRIRGLLADTEADHANDMIKRFNATGQPAYVEAAVEAYCKALDLTADDTPNRDGYLFGLASALHLRSRLTNSPEDLDAAVGLAHDAVDASPAGHERRPTLLHQVATIRFARYEHHGSADDLEAAITAGREAVTALPTGHLDRAAPLVALGTALRARFERAAEGQDLTDAVAAFQEASDAAPPGHPHRGPVMANLGPALQVRFERQGDPKDLDDSVTAGREAIGLFPAGSPHRATALSNLGSALRARFVHTGTLSDADEAVGHLREAADLAAPGSSQRALCCANLGAALYARYDRLHDRDDLDQAVIAGREAVEATPPTSPAAGSRLSAFNAELRTRFQHFGDVDDLDEAIETGRSAVDAVPAGHPHRPGYLSNLVAALGIRYEHQGDARDLDEAIGASRETIDETSTPKGHPNRALRLYNHGNILSLRARAHGGDADREAAVAAWLEAADLDTAPPPVRLRAAWAATAELTAVDTGRAADAAERAVRLLPRLTSRRLTAGDGQHAVGGFAGLAREAAALVLAGPDAPDVRGLRALRLLETGRGLLLSQALDARSDLTDLKAAHPHLADRYTELRELLDRAPYDATGTVLAEPAESLTGRPRPGHRDLHRLAVEMENVLGEIRSRRNFSTFALPPDAAELLVEAADGPLVVLNVADARGDALIVRPDGVVPLPLPGLTTKKVAEQVAAFHGALRRCGSKKDVLPAQRVLDGVLQWLWDTAAGPVLDALGTHARCSGQDREDPMPRVWWVPGGPLALLPLHAAGHHADPSDAPDRRTVLDRVVSSYTPTVRALRYARERAREAGTPSHSATASALVVAMPATPGLPPDKDLKGVRKEVAAVRSVWPASEILMEAEADATVPGTPPTRDAVLARLPHHPVAHFACHGESDPTDPSQSGLLLHDHATGRLTVASLRPVTLDGAQLAYLSACRTAVTEATELTDESIHLVSAMQLAGFPQVIGTLWQVADTVAADLAAEFYEQLTTDAAAAVLHRATLGIRARYPRFPYLWAAYLHSGG